MAECSACVRDALGYAEEYKEITKRRRAVSLAFALVAALVLSVALWAIWRAQSHEPPVAKSPAIPNQPSLTPLIAEAGARKDNQSVSPNLTPVTIDLRLSWRGAANSQRPIILPRGHLQLEIRLPIGSPEGAYKLRISDASGKVRHTAESPTRSVDGNAWLQVALHTSVLSPGNYKLELLEPEMDEWVDYLLIVR